MTRVPSTILSFVVRALLATTLLTGGVIVASVGIASATGTGTVSGVITNAPSGTCVYLTSDDGVDANDQEVLTNGSGAYTFTDVANDFYTVQADPSCYGDSDSSSYAGAYYDTSGGADHATPTFSSATAFQSTGGTISSINETLTTGGTIDGTVSFDSAPLANVCIEASDSTDSWQYFGVTASDGTYSIIGAAFGSYDVEYDPTCFGSQSTNAAPTWYSGEADENNATPMTISSTSPVAYSPSLAAGATISGNVVGANGQPLSSVCVYLFSPAPDYDYYLATDTGSNGTFSFSGLAADTFTIYADPTCEGVQTTDFKILESTSVTQAGQPNDLGQVTLQYGTNGAPSISQSNSTFSATVGTSFSQSLSVNGGTSPFTWSASGLPSGLSISSSSGVISGTPTSAGNSTVNITATDASAQATEITGSVQISVSAAQVTTTTTTTTTLPVVVPPPTPVVSAPKPVATVTVTSVALTAGKASIPIKCGDATCKGSVELVEVVQHSVVVKVKKGKKTVDKTEVKTTDIDLGSASYSAKKGKTTTADVVLNATGKSVLKDASKTHALHESLITSVRGGKSKTKSITVT